MRDRLIFTGQLLFTLVVAAFLVVPAILSISAGVTVNYFRGISSGVTLQWVFQVWDLYAGTILLSFVIAFATLAVTLFGSVWLVNPPNRTSKVSDVLCVSASVALVANSP